MKIFDCFMYFDEEIVLDLRLNILDKYVDYFIIVESIYTHKGDKRNLKFNPKKFTKFQNKIKYFIYDKIPEKIEPILENDNENDKARKYIMNAVYRENGQRDFISSGLKDAKDNDLILISDVDEIPNLNNLNFNALKEKIIIFKQDMFYYKLNLKLPNIIWSGTKACKKKNLLSPQWLRNIKDRKYPFFRLDTFFSKKKYTNIKFIDNGGWHFSNIKTAQEIEHKLRSYLHHQEFDENPMTTNEIENVIKNKQAIYDLKVDQRVSKIGGTGSKLVQYPFEKLPQFIQNNQGLYKEWID
jgi:beta-1,4-mannosyl-glycoprotein beta-1,4-N-acetylglucosaminyltransferase